MKILLDGTDDGAEETVCHALGRDGDDAAPVLTSRWNADT